MHLVYFESYPTARDAIERESQLKKWRREKKDRLVAMRNRTWRDLSMEITEELPRIDEPLPPEEMT